MAKFKVQVQDAEYEIDAPDERVAWEWAHQAHNSGQFESPEPKKDPDAFKLSKIPAFLEAGVRTAASLPLMVGGGLYGGATTATALLGGVDKEEALKGGAEAYEKIAGAGEHIPRIFDDTKRMEEIYGEVFNLPAEMAGKGAGNVAAALGGNEAAWQTGAEAATNAALFAGPMAKGLKDFRGARKAAEQRAIMEIIAKKKAEEAALAEAAKAKEAAELNAIRQGAPDMGPPNPTQLAAREAAAARMAPQERQLPNKQPAIDPGLQEPPVSDGGVRWTGSRGEPMQGMAREVPTVDFPLRQEVLTKGDAAAQIKWLREAHKEALERGDMVRAKEISEMFGDFMKDYGVRNPQEAIGLQPLFEKGREIPWQDGTKTWDATETRLPVETGRNPALSETQNPPYTMEKPAKGKLPIERQKTAAEIMGKRQGGQVNPEVFREGWEKAKTIFNKVGQKFNVVIRGSTNGPTVSVYDNNQNRVAHYTFDLAGKTNDPQAFIYSLMSGVKEEYRKTGITEKVYKFVRDEVGDVRASFEQTSDASATWRALRDKGVAERAYWDNTLENLPEDGYGFGESHPKALENLGILQDTSPIRDNKLGQLSRGNKERGSIEEVPNRDPEFQNFKNQLPKPMQKDATRLWKQYQEMSKDPVIAELSKPGGLSYDGPVIEALKNNPGFKDTLDYVYYGNKTFEEVKPKMMAESDITQTVGGKNVMAGGRLTGLAKRNTLISYVADHVNRAMSNADAWMYEKVLGKDSGFTSSLKALNNKERGELQARMALAEGKELLTPELLSKEGFNEKQIKYVVEYRRVMDEVFDNLNQARVAAGFKPLDKRLSYIPGRFRGKYYFIISDEAGKVMHLIGENDRKTVNKLRQMYQEKFPEYSFSDIKEKEYRGGEGSAYKGYHDLLEILSENDPRVQALESVFQEWQSQSAFDYLNQKRHFKHKSKEPVGGAQGFKAHVDPITNFNEGIKASLDYAKQSAQWVEMQKAAQEVKKVFADPELQVKQPTAMKYAKEYWEQAKGNHGDLAKVLDQAVNRALEIVGFNYGAGTKFLRETKALETLAMLSYPAFWVTQRLQPLFVVPTWISYMNSQGMKGHGYVAQAQAISDIIAGGKSTRKHAPYPLSKVGAEALEWWQKQGGEIPPLIEDYISLHSIKNATSIDGAYQYAKHVAGKPLATAEAFSRQYVFMTFTHYLWDNGFRGEHLFNTARALTDMGMVDYRPHERALVYQKLGEIGQQASALTTFKHNQYSQLYAFSKYGKDVSMRPLLTMVTLQAIMGGFFGMYALNEIDSIVEGLTGLLENYGVGKKTSLKREMIANPDVHDFFKYGLISWATQMDFSSKFSAANVLPDSPAGAITPFGTDIYNKMTAVAEMFKKRDEGSAKAAAYQLAPTIARGPMETAMKQGDMAMDPRDPNKGLVRRDHFDDLARFLGVRSLKESKELAIAGGIKAEKKDMTDMRLVLASRIVKEKDVEKKRELIKEYAKYGGSVNSIMADAMRYSREQRTTRLERETQVRSPSSTNAANRKRTEDLRGAAAANK